MTDNNVNPDLDGLEDLWDDTLDSADALAYSEFDALEHDDSLANLGPEEVSASDTDWFDMWVKANSLAVKLIHERDALQRRLASIHAIAALPTEE